VTFLKVFKVYVEYCGSVIVVYKYNRSVVDVDGVLQSMWKCYSGL
jgi:hypothetical protein